MSTLTEFLLERIAEDERRVRSGYPFDTFEAHEGDYEWDSDALMASWHTARCGHRHGEAMWNGDGCSCDVPSRVLAECAAKRRIVERYRELVEPDADGAVAFREGDEHGWVDADRNYHMGRLGDEYADGHFYAARAAVRDLAAVYRDHPAYQPGWAPADTEDQQ